MKKVTTLLVLNETERRMLVEALTQYLNFKVREVKTAKNQKTEQMSQLLSVLGKQNGGFKIIVSENNLFYLTEALVWYGRMLQPSPDMDKINEYVELSHILDGRNKNIFLFGEFNPKQYKGHEKEKDIQKYDFSQDRLLLIRFEKNQMEFIQEFHRQVDENDENYTSRAKQKCHHENIKLSEMAKNNSKFNNMQYQLVFFSEMKNHPFKKDFHYSI